MGLAAFCAVYGAVTLMMAYFMPFRRDPPKVLWGFPLAMGGLLLAGILAYCVAGLVAALFLAGRRLANKGAPPFSGYISGNLEGDREEPPNKSASAPVLRKFLRGLVPALAEYLWVLVWMGVFSLVSTPVVIGLTKYLTHRAG